MTDEQELRAKALELAILSYGAEGYHFYNRLEPSPLITKELKIKLDIIATYIKNGTT